MTRPTGENRSLAGWLVVVVSRYRSETMIAELQHSSQHAVRAHCPCEDDRRRPWPRLATNRANYGNHCSANSSSSSSGGGGGQRLYAQEL